MSSTLCRDLGTWELLGLRARLSHSGVWCDSIHSQGGFVDGAGTKQVSYHKAAWHREQLLPGQLPYSVCVGCG